MCLKIIYDWIKKIIYEVIKPNNVAQYLVYGIIALMISTYFISSITPSPEVNIISEDNIDNNHYRIRIKNIGNKATENLEFRILYSTFCFIGIDEAERKYLNETKMDFTGEYNDSIHNKKWIIEGVKLNQDVEFSFICERNQPIEIRVSGSNFREVIKKINN